MNLAFHRLVQRDINDVLSYYSERSTLAADRFWAALEERFQEISVSPERFGYLDERRGLRRVLLRRFPYLIVYYLSPTGIKVTCVKHKKRHPLVGLLRR
jgi:plasmid stabilization system protein ParE